MASRTRESLKRYFRQGALPTEDHFADLIDSMLNMSDEGFRKTVEQGFEVYAPQGHNALLSFFRDQSPDLPAWQIGLSGAHDKLVVHGRAADPAMAPESAEPASQPVLTLTHETRVGIGVSDPGEALEVAGTICSTGRRGVEASQAVPLLADGKWHDVITGLHGCQAFEVMAGAGLQTQGHFALMHAVALNAYNPTLGLFNFFNRRRGIQATHAYYSRHCDRLHLRWKGSSGKNADYSLQIRSGFNYGAGVKILVNLTRLWFDPHMDRGQPSNETRARD